MSRSLSGRWSHWFSRRGRTKSPARPRAAFRPAFEHLEDRVIPATRVWSGASLASANWNDTANWVGGVAPTTNDDLVFPGGGAQASSSNNDITGGSFSSI